MGEKKHIKNGSKWAIGCGKVAIIILIHQQIYGIGGTTSATPLLWSPTGLAVPSLQDPSSHLPWTCHLALAPASWSKRTGLPQVKCGPSSMVFS